MHITHIRTVLIHNIFFFSLFTFPNLAAVELELDLCALNTHTTNAHTHTHTLYHAIFFIKYFV